MADPAAPPGTGDGAKGLALITGASTGIGADLARVFARHGHPLALTARSGARLEALADELAASPGGRPRTFALDLAEPGAVDDLATRLREAGAAPAILVNNAGFGLIGRFSDLERSAQLNLIDLNIRTLTGLTHTFLPDIIAARGAIMNVASVAAFFPGPGMAVYYASKAYVLSFSEALSLELAADGVSVSALCPGPTETEFFTRAGALSGRPEGMGFIGRMASMPVAEAGYAGLMAGRRVVAPGWSNRFLTMASRLAPKQLSMRVIARIQLLRRA